MGAVGAYDVGEVGFNFFGGEAQCEADLTGGHRLNRDEPDYLLTDGVHGFRALAVHPALSRLPTCCRRPCPACARGPRDTDRTAYRCFLPDLTGFTAVRHAGSSCH